MTYALEGVVQHGTGTAAYFGRPAAGKTGTAENYVDAWFCGYVPQLATCVWVGYPKAEIPLYNVEGTRAVFGGSLPARDLAPLHVGSREEPAGPRLRLSAVHRPLRQLAVLVRAVAHDDDDHDRDDDDRAGEARAAADAQADVDPDASSPSADDDVRAASAAADDDGRDAVAALVRRPCPITSFGWAP